MRGATLTADGLHLVNAKDVKQAVKPEGGGGEGGNTISGACLRVTG